MNKHRYATGIFFLIIFSSMCYSQSIESVTGNVVNVKNELLWGNALIVSPLDSTLKTGTSFLEGKFVLKNLRETKLLLKLTSMEFKDTFINVEYKGVKNIDLGNIMVSGAQHELKALNVISTTPLFQTKADGTVQVNVENTILRTSNSLEEILSKSPNVLVEDNGISVLGKGTAILYLNGQRILNNQLANIQTSEIKSIEIISNPSVKYDAEGQAVINIITVKPRLEEIKGTISQNITVSDFATPSANTSISLDYKNKKISLTSNYSLQPGVYRFILNTTRSRDKAGDFFRSTITTDWERKQKYFANYGVGVQYNITKKGYFSITYNGLTNKLGGTETSHNQIMVNNKKEQLNNVVYKNDLTIQNALIFNYLQTIDTLGSSLYVGSQYSLYTTTINDLIKEENIQENRNSKRILKNPVYRKIPLLTAQVDYTKLFNPKNKLEAGIKLSHVNNASASEFYVSSNGSEFIFDENLSIDFNYHEEIYGVYATYQKALQNSITYSIGLRTELTSYGLSTSKTSPKAIKRNYFNLFPNFSLSKSFTESRSVFTSYSSRIARPRYQSLNPAIIYQDAFTSIQGNPNIIPEKIHSFEMGTNFKNFTLKFGYNYTLDPITGGAVQGETPKTYVLKNFNSHKGHDVFGSLSLPVNLSWWSSANTLTINYNKLIDHQSSFGFKETKPRAYVYSNNKFTLPQGFKLQLLAWYLSNRYDGIYFRKNQAEITLGLEKDLFNKALKLQLVANDIFHMNKPDGNYQLGETFILFDRIYNTQYFRLMATYNFGKLKKSHYQRKSPGTEENNRL